MLLTNMANFTSMLLTWLLLHTTFTNVCAQPKTPPTGKNFLTGDVSNTEPREKAADTSTESYLINKNGIQLTSSQFHALSPKLQKMLRVDGYLDSQMSQSRSRTKRSLSVNTPSAVINYIEDSGSQLVMSNPLQISGDSEIDHVTIEILNILDVGHEILTISPFIMTHTTDVGGRNVTFTYEVTPTSTYSNGLLTITDLANKEEYERAINSLRYENTDPEPSASLRGIGIVLHYEDTQVFANVYFFVLNANDSPHFASQPPDLFLLEDTTLYAQIGSSSIPFLGDSVVDSDFNSQLGIAILGADNSHGKWKYLTTSGLLMDINDGNRNEQGNILRNTSLEQTCVVLSERYIVFIPDENFNGETSITVVAWDKTGSTSSLFHGDFTNVTWTAPGDPFSQNMGTITVAIVPVNDAPVVNQSVDVVALASINEDSSDSQGIQMSNFLSACDDVDLQYDSSMQNIGVAITGVDANNGLWQYTTDGAQIWHDIINPSVLLGENMNELSYRVRFIPKTNFHGTANVSFRCWDFTAGQPGDTGVDSSYAGNFGAYSLTEVPGVVTVLPVNDAPSFLLDNLAFPLYERATELNALGVAVDELTASLFRDDDGDTPGMAIIGLTENDTGYFRYKCDTSGTDSDWVSLSTGTAISRASATLLSSNCRIRFVSTTLSNQIPEAVFHSIAWDGSDGLSPGATGIDTTTSTTSSFGATATAITVTLTAVTNRPLLTGNQASLVYTEGDQPITLFEDIELTSSVPTTFGQLSVSLIRAVDFNYEKLAIGSTLGYPSENALVEDTSSTIAWNTHNTELTIRGNFSAATCNKILKSMTFVHLSTNPTVSVGAGRYASVTAANVAGVDTDPFTRPINLIVVNSNPRITADVPFVNSTLFGTNDSHVLIFENSSLTISDEDDTRLSIGQLTLEQNVDGSQEYLTLPQLVEVTTYQNSTIQIIKVIHVTSNYNFTTSTLTFSLDDADASFGDHQAALQHATYCNSASLPELGIRLIGLSVLDEDGASSNVITAAVDVRNRSRENLPVPKIFQLIAFPYTQIIAGNDEHTDSKLSSGDEIKIFFDVETNMAPFGYYDVNDPVASFGKLLTQNEIEQMFEFHSPLNAQGQENAFVGKWVSSKIFRVLILNEGYPQASIKVGAWTVTPRVIDACLNSPDLSDITQRYCIRDRSGQSNPLTDESPLLRGSLGFNVPSAFSIIARNAAIVHNTTVIVNGSTIVMAFRPALSQVQMDRLCAQQFQAIFGMNVFSEFPDLFGSLTGCRNDYIEDWDTSANQEGHVPTVTKLFFQLDASTLDHLASDVTRAMANSLNESLLFQIVSEDTGADITSLREYTSARTSLNVPRFLVEHRLDLTPEIVSSSVVRHHNVDDNNMHAGDSIALQFNKDTNTPPVGSKELLDKVVSFHPEIVGNYTGSWSSHDKLVISILEVNNSIPYLTIRFRNNTFDETDSKIPHAFSDHNNCIGNSVCGDHPSSLGVCDVTGTSCRVQSAITLRVNEDAVEESGIGWWWVLILGLLLSGSILVIACLVNHIHSFRKIGVKSYRLNSDESPKSLFPRTCWNQFGWCSRESMTSDDLFWSHASKTHLAENEPVTPTHFTKDQPPSISSSVFSIPDTTPTHTNHELPLMQRPADNVYQQSQVSLRAVAYGQPENVKKEQEICLNNNVRSSETNSGPLTHVGALARWHSAVSMVCQQLGGNAAIETESPETGPVREESRRGSSYSSYIPSFSKSPEQSDIRQTAEDVIQGQRHNQESWSVTKQSISGLPISVDVADI